jgi:hypothetical protein
MASRLPLVIANGVIEQLQSGDTLNVSSSFAVTQTNGEGSVSLVIGMACYSSAADTVKRAQANASATDNVVGLWATSSTSHGSTGSLQWCGILTATTGQWDAVVTGESGGLTAGSTYYLDPATPGYMTAAAPTTAGQYIVPLGVALSTTEFEINISPSILL